MPANNLKHLFTTKNAEPKKRRFYFVWSGMKNRCKSIRKANVVCYRNKGIKVCDRWEKFENFKEDMWPTYKQGLSIDRINNDGNYCKENCRWATPKEQALNRRQTRLFFFKGKNLTLSDWARELKIKNKSRLSMRYYVYGWSLDKTLSTP